MSQSSCHLEEEKFPMLALIRIPHGSKNTMYLVLKHPTDSDDFIVLTEYNPLSDPGPSRKVLIGEKLHD